MFLKYSLLVIIMTFALFPSNSLGQDILWKNSVGVFGGGNFNLHSISMNPNFSAASARPHFDEPSNSFSGFGGIEANFQVASIIVLTGKVSYDFTGADFAKRTAANTNNTLNTQLNYLYLAPMFKFVNLLPFSRPIYFTAGVNFGIPMINNYDFQQRTGTLRPRTDSGYIPDADLRISLPVGIGYIYRLSQKFSIIPEISYHFPISEVSANPTWQQWNFQQLKAGISITYMLPSFAKKREKPKIIHSPDILEPRIKQVNYVDKAGKALPLNGIQLEEVEFGEYFPLIPYIFYDINDTELDATYKLRRKQVVSASGETIYGGDDMNVTNAVDVNYKLLDIIGKRMESNTRTNLVVTGTIDGKFETEKEISYYRALGVKKYLVSNYKIDSNRITIKYGLPPAKPSAQTVKDGVVENRRVELSSNSSTLFEPYFVRGENQRIASPNVIEFVPVVRTNKDVIAWDMEIYHADRLIKKLAGDVISKNKSNTDFAEVIHLQGGRPIETDARNNGIGYGTEDISDYNLAPVRINLAMNELYSSQVPIEYKYSIYSSDSVASVIGSIPVDFFSTERKRSISQKDKVITKYSLVLFDFDSANISEQNRLIIDKYVIPNIKYGATVDIYGFSDRIGQAEYNKRLSIARANAVKDYILTKNKNVLIKADGLGIESEIFDNNFPIGRQLSRTVQIFIVSPK